MVNKLVPQDIVPRMRERERDYSETHFPPHHCNGWRRTLSLTHTPDVAENV